MTDPINEEYIVFGNKTTDGSWKLETEGEKLTMKKRESGTWNNKQEYIP